MPSASERLLEGNRRFVASQGPGLERHLAGQRPFAAVLTCSDSRVVPEFIFDVGIGDIFVVRDAGNTAIDPSELGSLEYAVEHLHVPLVLILGHTHCGALNAAEQGPGDDSNVGRIVNGIRCCFGEADHLRANIRMQMRHLLERSPIISSAAERGDVEIRGAVYRMEDGTVEFLD